MQNTIDALVSLNRQLLNEAYARVQQLEMEAQVKDQIIERLKTEFAAKLEQIEVYTSVPTAPRAVMDNGSVHVDSGEQRKAS